MPDAGWVPVANSAAQNHGISWRAKGLLLELLSYPDGWETTVDDLVALGQRAGGHAEGRDAMRTAMNELVQAGYVVRVRRRGNRGQWLTTLEVSDDPTPADRRTENPASVSQSSENQSSVSQSSDFQSVNRKTETNTETNTKDQTSSDQHSASLASLATAADAAADDDRQNRRLQHAYDVIEGMSPDLRRRHLLTIERRRPKIYRECRNEAIRQLERKDPNALKGTHSALAIDRLSYKWMVQHYAPTWPQWIARLIDDAYRSLDSRA